MLAALSAFALSVTLVHSAPRKEPVPGEWIANDFDPFPSPLYIPSLKAKQISRAESRHQSRDWASTIYVDYVPETFCDQPIISIQVHYPTGFAGRMSETTRETPVTVRALFDGASPIELRMAATEYADQKLFFWKSLQGDLKVYGQVIPLMTQSRTVTFELPVGGALHPLTFATKGVGTVLNQAEHSCRTNLTELTGNPGAFDCKKAEELTPPERAACNEYVRDKRKRKR